MKKLKNTLLAMFAIATCSLLMQSCSEEAIAPDQKVEISGEVIAQFTELGFDVSDIN